MTFDLGLPSSLNTDILTDNGTHNFPLMDHAKDLFDPVDGLQARPK